MWRVVSRTIYRNAHTAFLGVALTFFSSVATAQQPCTTDAGRIVSELYRHMLERAPDPGAQHWQNELAGGLTVRDLVRQIATSQEHQQRFGQTESGEAQPYERAVARLYRHIFGRQPDPDGQRSGALFAQSSGLSAVAESLVASDEYTRAFGDWAVPGSGGLRYCPPNQVSRAAPAPALQPAPRGQATEYRYRGMDRNNDGAITRNEWRGNPQSFDIQDWDGNGVLEGNEVRPGAQRQGRAVDADDLDRGERFDFLDVDGNNRIERREWQGNVETFNQMDRNRDSTLSRAEVQNWVGADNDTTVGTTGDVVIVDSMVRWTDTGITVRQGQTLVFDAEGRISLSDGRNDFATAGGGSVTGRRAGNAPVPAAPAGGLIARIGNGTPVYVGDRRALRVPAGGRLYLGVNDDYLDDNDGQYRVTVDVR